MHVHHGGAVAVALFWRLLFPFLKEPLPVGLGLVKWNNQERVEHHEWQAGQYVHADYAEPTNKANI